MMDPLQPGSWRLDGRDYKSHHIGNTRRRLLAVGKLRTVKRGTSTLVLLMGSIREYIASLPAAIFQTRN